MRLFDINGKQRWKNTAKYRIEWDKKSKSKIQFIVKQFLKQFWFSQIVYEEFPVYGSLLKVDFLNATRKIIIEVQGPQHTVFNKFFHNNSRVDFFNQIKRDYTKLDWAAKNNFKFIEIEGKEIPSLSKDFFEKKFNIPL